MNLSKRLICCLFLFLLIPLTSCGLGQKAWQRKLAWNKWIEPNGKLKVLATTGMIGDIIEQIGQNSVDTLTLISNDLDPHSYQMVKGDDEKFAYADLIFYNGLGLEHSHSMRKFLHDNPKSISVGDYVKQVKEEEMLYYDSQIDPHIWMDLSLWKQVIPLVVQVLSEKDPVHAENFRREGQKLYRTFDQQDQHMAELLARVPEHKRYMITSHDAFNYFARKYLATPQERESNTWQKRFQAPEGLSPDSSLNPHEIEIILSHMQQHHIEVLFPESNLSTDSLKKIQDAGHALGLSIRICQTPLYGDAMGPPGSDQDHYLGMQLHNAQTLHRELP